MVDDEEIYEHNDVAMSRDADDHMTDDCIATSGDAPSSLLRLVGGLILHKAGSLVIRSVHNVMLSAQSNTKHATFDCHVRGPSAFWLILLKGPSSRIIEDRRSNRRRWSRARWRSDIFREGHDRQK